MVSTVGNKSIQRSAVDQRSSSIAIELDKRRISNEQLFRLGDNDRETNGFDEDGAEFHRI